MKKIKSLFLPAFIALITIPTMAAAETAPDRTNYDPGGALSTDPGDIWRIVNAVINWMFWILLVAAVVFILLGAWKFLTSAGNSDETKKAQNYVLWAVIAIVVAFLAKAIVLWVVGLLGATTPDDFFGPGE